MEEMEMTIKIEVEVAETSAVHSDSEIGLNHLKSEPGSLQPVKSESVLSIKEEILEDCTQTTTMEQMEMSIKTEVEMAATSAAHNDSQMDLDFFKQDPGLLQSIKCEPSSANDTSSKEEILEDSAEDKKATSHSCAQTTTEVDYDEAHMKSVLRLNALFEKEDLRKLLLRQHRTTSSNTQPHVQSLRAKLYHQNSRKVVSTRGIIAGPSNQSRDKKIESKQKLLACSILENEYSSRADLDLDKRLHSGVKLKNDLVNYVSHIKKKHCDESFAQSGDLAKNMVVDTGEKPFQCKICDARFAQNGGLTQHMRVHTGEKPYQCTMCDAKFAQSNNLTLHMRVHTGEKPYKCKICDARFANSSGLPQHMRVHTGEKPYQCKTCDAKFAQRGHLTRHMNVHTGEKPFQCQMCDARFAEKAALNQHKKVHTGEKPYQCNMCDAKFAQNTNLTQHMRVHTGEKPYQCKICFARFAQHSSLTLHKRVHTGEKPYQCETCDAKFSQRGHLTRHMRVHTE